jgi:hypothetical protein
LRVWRERQKKTIRENGRRSTKRPPGEDKLHLGDKVASPQEQRVRNLKQSPAKQPLKEKLEAIAGKPKFGRELWKLEGIAKSQMWNLPV